MSRFVHDETDAIDLGSGDVVHIRRKMSYAQQRVVSSLRAKYEDIHAATSEYLVLLLELNVVSWEGPGFQNGSGPMPLTRASFDALDPDIGTRLANEIATRNGVKPDPLATSAESSSPPSEVTAEESPASTPSSRSASDSVGRGTS